MGSKTGFYGAIGNDEYGKFLKTDFKKERVDISYLIVNENKTPVNFIFIVNTTGEKVIIQSPFMHQTVPDDRYLDVKLFKKLKLIHSTAIYPNLTKKAFEMAKKFDVKTSLDLESQVIEKHGQKTIRQMVKYVDILVPNKQGAMKITNQSTPMAAAEKFIDWGIEIVIMTLGRDGALIVTQNGTTKIPSFDVEPLDTTGAGDTFCASFDFAYVIKKWPLKESCIFANAAAALKCLKVGARTGMPSFKEVNEFLKEKGVHIGK